MVLGWLEQLTGTPVRTIHIVGGGTQNRQLCQMTADACQRPVLAGPVEATAIGNVMMQAIAQGDVGSIEQAREIIGASFPLDRYAPRDPAAWNAAYPRFERLFG
jgi:rhamnulokinase